MVHPDYVRTEFLAMMARHKVNHILALKLMRFASNRYIAVIDHVVRVTQDMLPVATIRAIVLLVAQNTPKPALFSTNPPFSILVNVKGLKH